MNMSVTATHPREQRLAALIVGITLLIMAAAAFVSFGYVHSTLTVPDDANATFHNLRSSSALFTVEIIGWLLILICDIIVAWGIYVYFKAVHRSMALLSAWFRLIYAALLGIAIMNLLQVQQLMDSAYLQTLFGTAQAQAHVLSFIGAFESMWSFGLIIFSMHLLIIGWLACVAKTVPNGLSVLLIFAGIGYLVTSLIDLAVSGETAFLRVLIMILTVPMTIGEPGFGLWLLIKGGKPVS